VLSDAFGIVIAPPPLRPGVVGANSITSSSRKRTRKISTPSPATNKPQRGPRATTSDSRTAVSPSSPPLPTDLSQCPHPQNDITMPITQIHNDTHPHRDREHTVPEACTTQRPHEERHQSHTPIDLTAIHQEVPRPARDPLTLRNSSDVLVTAPQQIDQTIHS